MAAADGKLGCYFGNTAATNYFGRFIPDHFAVSAASIVNRSALAACVAPGFQLLWRGHDADLHPDGAERGGRHHQ
ncbi:hypothetical protein LP420_01385 [Massilia sp. B-10]|nr:hypothetical protein LP420_01385 [Massilia sp. B-10]